MHREDICLHQTSGEAEKGRVECQRGGSAGHSDFLGGCIETFYSSLARRPFMIFFLLQFFEANPSFLWAIVYGTLTALTFHVHQLPIGRDSTTEEPQKT